VADEIAVGCARDWQDWRAIQAESIGLLHQYIDKSPAKFLTPFEHDNLVRARPAH
jgi:hypothetical protein